MLSIEEGKDYDDVDDSQLPYTLLRNLGCGGSGNVEEVRDEVTKAVFARKIIRIPRSKVEKRKRTEVFRNEVQVIRGLGSHRHIISVYATYAAKREFALILQPVADSGDLEEFLADYWSVARELQDPNVPNARLKEMAPILEQAFGCLAVGMAYMHEKKVRHKDVKTRNILVHNNRVIYTDFGYSFDSNGFSRSATDGKPGPLTKKYSAPEVLGHEKRDSSSDIYSLGCVFIDILSALALAMDPDDKEITCFSESMDEIHRRIILWKVLPQFSSLPKIITRMTTFNPSKRLCAIHTAREIFRVPDLYCSDCAATPIDPREGCVKVGRCIKGPMKVGKDRVAQIKMQYAANERKLLTHKEHGTKPAEHEKFMLRPVSAPLSTHILEVPDMEAAKKYQHPTVANEEQRLYRGKVALDYHTDDRSSHPQLPVTTDVPSSPNPLVETTHAGALTSRNNRVKEFGNQSALSDAIPPGNLGRTWSEPLQKHSQWTLKLNVNSILRRHTSQNPHLDPRVRSIDALPADVQANLGYRSQRYIRASSDKNDAEALDSTRKKRGDFFVTGRVFKMLWLDPDGQVKPGCTRGSTHFSTVEYESWIQEIRTFLVVRHLGASSQCIPVQTYRNCGATKPGLTQQQHGVIHTSKDPPSLQEGEHLTKWPIRVIATGKEVLEHTSRVNYGKPYVVEHSVKVLDVGRVVEENRYLIEAYLRSATEEVR